MTWTRHGRACPGHPDRRCKMNRDARDKRGHDAAPCGAIRIRDELAKLGVVLKDTKDGTTWEIAR